MLDKRKQDDNLKGWALLGRRREVTCQKWVHGCIAIDIWVYIRIKD